MRVWALSAGLMVGVAATPAWAETWVAPAVFESGTGECRAAQVGNYTYTLEGLTFTVANQAGRMLTTTVSENGDVSKDFKSSSGARLRVVGNVKPRDLAIVNTDNGCRWKTAAKQ